jgi:hypothetical protein
MTPEERIAVMRRGASVLRSIEAARRAALPPPEEDSLTSLSALRDVMGLADRIEMWLEMESTDPMMVYARDAGLSSAFDPYDQDLLESLEPEAGGREAQGSFREFRALVERYVAREFWPPDSYFNISTPEP